MTKPKVQPISAEMQLAAVREERKAGRILVEITILEGALERLDRAERSLRLIRTEALTQAAAHLLAADSLEERDLAQEPIVVGKGLKLRPTHSREFYVEKTAQLTLDGFVKDIDAIVKAGNSY